jgi:multiple sugar transport system permease protein
VTRKEWYVPYTFLIPALGGLLLFQLAPILYGLWRSAFTQTFGLTGGSLVLSGFDNYRNLWTDPVFWSSLKTTLVFNVILTPLQVVLALLLAILVNVPLRGSGFFRSIYFIPIAVSLTVTSVVWGLMLDSQSGLVNGILSQFGIPAQGFFVDPNEALGAVMLVCTWKGVGQWMIFFLAGLQVVPQSLYEAASIDGASRLGSFRYVTLPLLRRVILFVLVADTVSNFLLFAPAYVLTQGGPLGSTNLLVFEAFRSAFISADLGRATAITNVVLVLLMAVIGLEILILRLLDR